MLEEIDAREIIENEPVGLFEPSSEQWHCDECQYNH